MNESLKNISTNFDRKDIFARFIIKTCAESSIMLMLQLSKFIEIISEIDSAKIRETLASKKRLVL